MLCSHEDARLQRRAARRLLPCAHSSAHCTNPLLACLNSLLGGKTNFHGAIVDEGASKSNYIGCHDVPLYPPLKPPKLRRVRTRRVTRSTLAHRNTPGVERPFSRALDVPLHGSHTANVLGGTGFT